MVDENKRSRRDVLKSGTFSALGLAGVSASGMAQGEKPAEGENKRARTKAPDGVKVIENKKYRIIGIKSVMIDDHQEVIEACSEYPLAQVKSKKNKTTIKVNKKKINKNKSEAAKRAAEKAQKRVEAQQNRGSK